MFQVLSQSDKQFLRKIFFLNKKVMPEVQFEVGPSPVPPFPVARFCPSPNSDHSSTSNSYVTSFNSKFETVRLLSCPDGQTDGWTDGRTDGQEDPIKEFHSLIK